ncbi:hypothetical protein RhiirA4_488430, partial [Rhizophagus irregularis]
MLLHQNIPKTPQFLNVKTKKVYDNIRKKKRKGVNEKGKEEKMEEEVREGEMTRVGRRRKGG